MLTDLILAIVIIAFSGVFLWGLLALIGAFNNSPKESAKGDHTQNMSWFESCYEPCMSNPEHSSDLCIMMCAWNIV